MPNNNNQNILNYNNQYNQFIPTNPINNINNNFSNNNQNILYFKKICREMKSTTFPNTRYIIPKDWFDSLMNYNQLTQINNIQFLTPDKKRLKITVDERNFVLIIYEIMNYIHTTFLYDYIIEAKIIPNENDILLIKDIKVMGQNQFFEPDFRTGKKYAIINSYLKYPQFQLAINFGSTIKESEKEKEKEEANEIDLISKSDNESISKVSNSKYIYNPSNNKLFAIDSFQKKYIEPIGINNKSIYCYMISCLQVLLSIPELNFYFLYKKYKSSDQKTLICDDFSDFISLYKYFQKTHKNQIDIPSSIYNICHSFLPKGIMNDCEEFFILFLKSLQEELNKKSKDKNNINNDEEKNDIEKYWEDYRFKNSCFIDGLFCGLIRSTVICNKCKNETYNYEPFMDLAIPIPKKNKSIITCLNIYFDYELIDCDYHCEICNFKTSVRKII